MKIKIGTDFSGIGAPEMALKKIGLPHEIEFACEIDKFARKSYVAIHGEPKQFFNDITVRDHSKVENIDLYVAGFPCQAFSMAGKRNGFEDTRGTLFFNVAEFIKINKPECFVLENVKGLLSHDNGRTFETIISVLSDGGGTVNQQQSIPFYDDGLGYHIFWDVLNSKNYGVPQNRERVFIVGFKNFRKFRWPKPFRLKMKLKDVLELNVEQKYFLSNELVENLIQYNKRQKENNRGFSAKFRDVETTKTMDCLKIGGGGTADLIFIGDYRSDDGIRIRKDNNSPCLMASMKDDFNEKFAMRNPPIVFSKKIRRLTPLECFRLQSFPDDAFFAAQKVNSDAQLYKQAGNSITVDVLCEIFKKIYE